MYEPSGRSAARAAIVRSSPGSASCGAAVELAVVEAGALAGVAGRAGGLDEREHGVEVAVEAQRLHRLRVAGGRALVPQLVARAAVEMHLAGLARALQRLVVHVGQRQDLAGGPVLDDAGHEPASSKAISIGLRSLGACLIQVPGERAPARPLAAHDGEQRGERARRQRGDQALEPQRAAEERRVGVRERRRSASAPARGAARPPARRAARARRRSRSGRRFESPRRTAGCSGRPSRRRRTRRPRPPAAARAGTSCPGSGPARRPAGAPCRASAP